MKSVFLKYLFFGLFFSCFISVTAQYSIPQKPKILYPVYDEVRLLSEQEKSQLNQKLIKYEDSTSTEIEVIIIPSTEGEDINFLAAKFGEEWQIGKKDVDNGVVLLIATEDRTISIQQGRAVEQYLTASVAGQIIDYIITPNFREQNWYSGIDQGTDSIIDALQGRFKASKKEDGGEINWVFIVFFIIVLVLISYYNNKNNRRNNNDDDDVIITRRGSYYGGFPFFGGGGGSSGGGSFGGFGGGGSFGGGGASGGW